LFIFVLGQIGFESFGKFATSEHNTPPTALAFEPDIRAETCDNPLVGATGVLFSKAEMIIEAQVG
jgi:hypothetical protein